MGDGRPVEVRRYVDGSDRSQLEAFTCARYGEKWSEAAQQVIRDAPAAVGDDDIDCQILVADDDASVVGVVVFGADSDGRDVIHSLGVVISRQRQGIGSRLKRAVMAVNAGTDPDRSVVSHVHRNNYRMIRLNDKLGVKKEKDPLDGEYWIAVIRVAPED